MRLPLALAAGCAASLVAASAAAAVTGPVGRATARTFGGKTARFSLRIDAHVAGVHVLTSEQGSVSFRQRQAHVYKLVPGGAPQEIILVGPLEYTNANAALAATDRRVRPWTKLDRRKLSAARQARQIDDLTHVRALAYLPNGVAHASRVAHVPTDGLTAHYRGVVTASRLLRSVPAAERRSIRAALNADFTTAPFTANFWLDPRGRLVRVSVAYRTARGGRFIVRGTFSHFGAKLDLRLPPAREIADITP